MLKSLLISKHIVVPFCSILLATPLSLTCGCSLANVRPFADYSEYAIVPADKADAKDVKWATYLKKHFQKRSTDIDCVIATPAQDESQLQVVVDLNPTLETDYKVERDDKSIHLSARNTEAMLWLQYQFMAAASEGDARFASSDLPPSVLSCERDTAGTFAFEYRGIYSPSNSNADMLPILGTQNVDFDWGLWGHNMHKIFADGIIPTSAKALVDGTRSDEQFCFSNEATYKAYESFVIDNYGEGNNDETIRFAVMPNDNGEVCQCADCRKAGNTTTSATPAVTKMVERLARRFPKHLFFTSSYATTTQPPSHILPNNVGVLVSAMSLPLTTDIKNKAARSVFENTIKAWQKASNRIYVWDYMRNFDDYLTPYPCLHSLQSRLQYMKQLGVKGVFFNGSGYDYASFDDVQTYVIAQLLRDPDIKIEDACSKYFGKCYPVTASICNQYYQSIENRASKTTLSPYSGIKDLTKQYLDANEFNQFWNALDKASKGSTDSERKSLNKLLTALNFTRLELYRLQPQAPTSSQLSQTLGLLNGYKGFKDLTNYREAYGSLDEYIKQWSASYPWLKHSNNLLLHTTLKPLCKLDDEYTDLSILTDGKQGFTTDYHTGWVISAAKPFKVEVASSLPSNCNIHLSFLHAPKWHIYAPIAVEVWQNGQNKGKSTLSATTQSGFSRTEANVSVTGIEPKSPLEIRAIQNPKKGKVTLACDEIEAF